MAKQKSLQSIINRWNRDNPIGTVVDFTMDNGRTERVKTSSRAYLLSGHRPVIWLDGIVGCYSLDRVKVVKCNVQR